MSPVSERGSVSRSIPLAIQTAAGHRPAFRPNQARETRASFTGNMQVAVAGSTTPVLIPMAAGVPLVLPITRIYATNTSSGTIAVLS